MSPGRLRCVRSRRLTARRPTVYEERLEAIPLKTDNQQRPAATETERQLGWSKTEGGHLKCTNVRTSARCFIHSETFWCLCKMLWSKGRWGAPACVLTISSQGEGGQNHEITQERSDGGNGANKTMGKATSQNWCRGRKRGSQVSRSQKGNKVRGWGWI